MMSQPLAREIILVERSPLFVRMIANATKQFDANLVVAQSVPEALEKVVQCDSFALLTTLELPGFTGLSLIATLKSSPAYRAMPIALLTSRERQTLPDTPYQADQIIQKGANFSENIAIFLKDSGLEPSEPGPERKREKNTLDVHVLLVEDSPPLQMLTARFLRMAGARITVANNGLEAVHLAETEDYDLVLMDIEMPELDGKQATKRLRASGFDKPVIALTAHDADMIRAELTKIGFDGILSKPIKGETLIRYCRDYLATHRV